MIRTRGNAVEVDIQVVPNARKTEIVGEHGGRLKIKVHAPPVDGKANTEICAFFSQLCERPRAAVCILRGELSKKKTVLIEGLSAQALQNILTAQRQ